MLYWKQCNGHSTTMKHKKANKKHCKEGKHTAVVDKNTANIRPTVLSIDRKWAFQCSTVEERKKGKGERQGTQESQDENEERGKTSSCAEAEEKRKSKIFSVKDRNQS